MPVASKAATMACAGLRTQRRRRVPIKIGAVCTHLTTVSRASAADGANATAFLLGHAVETSFSVTRRQELADMLAQSIPQPVREAALARTGRCA